MGRAIGGRVTHRPLFYALLTVRRDGKGLFALVEVCHLIEERLRHRP